MAIFSCVPVVLVPLFTLALHAHALRIGALPHKHNAHAGAAVFRSCPGTPLFTRTLCESALPTTHTRHGRSTRGRKTARQKRTPGVAFFITSSRSLHAHALRIGALPHKHNAHAGAAVFRSCPGTPLFTRTLCESALPTTHTRHGRSTRGRKTARQKRTPGVAFFITSSIMTSSG